MNPKSMDIAAPLNDLELVLAALLETHRGLLAAIERKQEALRAADIDGVTTACREEEEIVVGVSELERRRIELVAVLSAELGGAGAAPLTMSQIAGALEGPRGATLRTLGDELRATVQQTRRRSAVVRAAADALNRHLIGIMQLATAALSRARIYGARGRIDAGRQQPACIDLRS